MRLRELFPHAQGDPEVTSLAYDGRSVQPGALFFCVRGFTRDGHDFAIGRLTGNEIGAIEVTDFIIADATCHTGT